MSDLKNCYGPPLPPDFSQIKDKHQLPEPCGPELPPNFKKPSTTSNIKSSADLYGPELPPSLKWTTIAPCGPELPPGFRTDNDVKDTYGPPIPPNTNEKDMYGPELPPKFRAKTSRSETVQPCGPSLPPNFKCSTEKDPYGPALPPSFQKKVHSPEVGQYTSSEEEGEDLRTIGPLIPGAELQEELRHWKSEASTSSNRGPGGSGLKRESWMTELPTPSKQVMGLQARKFRTNVVPVDTAGQQAWLSTPGEEEAVPEDHGQGFTDQREEFYRQAARARDREMEEQIVNYNLKHNRGDSMMDIHSKKRKKKEEKKRKKEKKRKRSRSGSYTPISAVPSRQPFDRDQDLRINSMDSASKKAFIQHSRSLSNKFAAGEQKYL